MTVNGYGGQLAAISVKAEALSSGELADAANLHLQLVA